MWYSKITSKWQTTIPYNVRKYLSVWYWDIIKFSIKNWSVVINKPKIQDLAYLKTVEKTLNEWDSKKDEKLFANL